jgi:uncharacterized protein
MKLFPAVAFTLAVGLVPAAFAQTSLGAGDIAYLGIKTNGSGGSPDSYTFVTFKDLTAGTRIYFTDNGWTGSGFRGSTAADYNGNEGVEVFEVKAGQTIPAGTVINSDPLGTASLAYTFQSVGGSGSLGTTVPSFANDGEQIYAFTSTEALPTAGNPLNGPGSATFLFALNTSATWTDATNSGTGNLAPGLANGSTALIRTAQANGSQFFDLSLAGSDAKTQAGWLAAIANPGNWSTSSSQTFALPTTSLAVVPEPHEYGIALAALLLAAVAVRRRQVRIA